MLPCASPAWLADCDKTAKHENQDSGRTGKVQAFTALRLRRFCSFFISVVFVCAVGLRTKSQAIELYCCIARGRGVEVIQASK